MSLETKVLYIQSSLDEKFRLILDKNWGSKNANHRNDIRNCLAGNFADHFSRAQLARLNDLTWVPEASDGHVSISHCEQLGGFAYSAFKIGFDVEVITRISSRVLKRTAQEAEFAACPVPEFLWVAKEAGFKALSSYGPNLFIFDLECFDWQSHIENQVFSFRLKSQKTLDFGLNKGFIFSEGVCLFAVFLK